MNIRKKKRLLLILILFIGIGFAAMATSFAINGSLTAIGGSWKVYFDNVEVADSSISINPEINSSKDTITFSADLKKDSDFVEFTVDVINSGSIDAMIYDFSLGLYDEDGNKIEIPDYLDLSVKYVTGEDLAKTQLLKSETAYKLKIVLKYSDSIDEDNLSGEDVSGTYKLNIEYRRAKGDTITVDTTNYFMSYYYKFPIGTVCKRAGTLHQEECKRDSGGCYAAGYYAEGTKGTTTITYGNLGTAGEAPKVGDAFDCDVDGNGKFDEEERFYYISDNGSNEGYATLIYYKNVATEKYYTSVQNYHGPTALLDKLPSKDEWTNPGLNTNMTRQILNENGENTSNDGGNRLPSFTYTNRAARLLTTQELESACGFSMSNRNTGDLDSCQYLLENTTYATRSETAFWWLETPVASNYNNVWYVDGNSRTVGYSNASNAYGVRPAIEVDKTKIAY